MRDEPKIIETIICEKLRLARVNATHGKCGSPASMQLMKNAAPPCRCIYSYANAARQIAQLPTAAMPPAHDDRQTESESGALGRSLYFHTPARTRGHRGVEPGGTDKHMQRAMTQRARRMQQTRHTKARVYSDRTT